jgi:hypothetical protein
MLPPPTITTTGSFSRPFFAGEDVILPEIGQEVVGTGGDWQNSGVYG